MLTATFLIPMVIGCLLMILYLKRCKHDWVVLSQTRIKSPFEMANDLGTPMTHTKGYGAFSETHTITHACNKCGKLHTVTTHS